MAKSSALVIAGAGILYLLGDLARPGEAFTPLGTLELGCLTAVLISGVAWLLMRRALVKGKEKPHLVSLAVYLGVFLRFGFAIVLFALASTILEYEGYRIAQLLLSFTGMSLYLLVWEVVSAIRLNQDLQE